MDAERLMPTGACGGCRRCRADRPDAVGELPLASVEFVIIERRTKHESDGSRNAGLPSQAVGTGPGLAASPHVVRQRSVAQTRSERGPTGLKGKVNG